jgi:ParB family chromosome partitioning protein
MAKSRVRGIAHLTTPGAASASIDNKDSRPVAETPRFSSAEFAKDGRTANRMGERVIKLSVDPKRCRAWKGHDRDASWYTAEGCADLIESIPKDGQFIEALAREVKGEPDIDYELIFGMRRRYACEVTGQPLKIVVTDIDDDEAFVRMVRENDDRKGITPMERALNYVKRLKAGQFASQDDLANKLRKPKGTISKMVAAAEIYGYPGLAKLLPDPKVVPLNPAYKLVSKMNANDELKGVILKAASKLTSDTAPGAIFKELLTAEYRSSKVPTFYESLNIGPKGRLEVNRNDKGKITMAIHGGTGEVKKEELLAAVSQVWEKLHA